MFTDLKIAFEFGIYNGSMIMSVTVNDICIAEYSNQTESLVTISSKIQLPCKMKIFLSGKQPNDTLVKDDKIIADKYVRLTAMSLGKIPVKENVLRKICLYNNIGSTFWGNGEVIIDFDCDNFIEWHLKNQNSFTL